MKKFIGFVIIIVACVWMYNRCTGSETPQSDVLKQVTVSAKVANLRTGPGTNYDILSVNADSTGGNYQVRRGTKLDVLSEDNGWFQVRVPGEKRTAYIKASLCNDPTASKGKRKGSSSRSSGASSHSSSAASPTPSEAPAAPAPNVSPNEEEVVEITTGRASQDEVFY